MARSAFRRIGRRPRRHGEVEVVEAAAIGEVEPRQHDEPEQHHDVIEKCDGNHDQTQNEQESEKMMTPPVAAIAAAAVAMGIEILAVLRAHLFLESALL